MGKSTANKNLRNFFLYKVFYNARFYYPIFTILFLDLGVTLEEFSLLNFVWAASIVLFEVPSGALADTIGRKPLIVSAVVLMCIEMVLLLSVPVGGGAWTFTILMINRVLSGLSEALGSGADEALAYDSIDESEQEKVWPSVIKRTMQWQSLAFFFAMIFGAVIYDQNLMTPVFQWLSIENASSYIIRLPALFTLLSGLFLLWVSLGFEEKKSEGFSPAKLIQCWGPIRQAMSRTWGSVCWVKKTPYVLGIIVWAVFFDHLARQFLTLSSEYFRYLNLPEYMFGILGSCFALIGFFTMPLAIRLYQKWTFKEMARNLSIFVFFTWLAIGFSASLWVLGAVLLLSGVSKVFEYFVSNELNKEVSADQRATILSIKGLSMNLGYGGIGILYSLFLYGTRLAGQDFPQGEMAYTLPYFPAYFLLLFVCLFLFSRKKFFISQPKSSS